MRRSSENVAAIATALAKAQIELANPAKSMLGSVYPGNLHVHEADCGFEGRLGADALEYCGTLAEVLQDDPAEGHHLSDVGMDARGRVGPGSDRPVVSVVHDPSCRALVDDCASKDEDRYEQQARPPAGKPCMPGSRHRAPRRRCAA